MSEILSSKEVDQKLAAIAREMKDQLNGLDHALGRGLDNLMVCADRKLHRLRGEWDKTLLHQGIACEVGFCRRITTLERWKFSCKGLHVLETSRITCPCCHSVVALNEHAMSSRIMWVISHAYALPEGFLPHLEINYFESPTCLYQS